MSDTKQTTREILAEMLTENTGRHMLDSGGAYGRNWERNQGRDFEAQPEATVSVDKWGIDVTLSTYHWLADRLDHRPDLDKLFDQYAETDPDMHWLGLMEGFPLWLRDEMDMDVEGGIYGDEGAEECRTINTYNDESNLTQTLQYVMFFLDGCECYLLQIHGGCDVRGGYTKPRGFEANGNHGEIVLWSPGSAGVCCSRYGEGCESRWYMSHGDSGWTNDEGHDDLNCYEKVELEGDEQPRAGVLCYDEDGKGFCPICGTGVLEGGSY